MVQGFAAFEAAVDEQGVQIGLGHGGIVRRRERDVMALIYHIALQSEWRQNRPAGWYAPPGLAGEGFVHASRLEQVVGSAERFFAGRPGLVLLTIDPSRLRWPVVFEPGSNDADRGMWFPHIYGSVNRDAVVAVDAFEPDAAGRFVLPARMAADLRDNAGC